MARWTVIANQPFRVIEIKTFERLMQIVIYSTFQKIHKSTLRSDVFRLYDMERNNLITLFEYLSDFKYNLTYDSWKIYTNESAICALHIIELMNIG